MSSYNFETVVEKEAEDEGYMAYSPTLPGCFGNGRTIEDARQSMRTAAQQHIETLLDHGQPIPKKKEQSEIGAPRLGEL